MKETKFLPLAAFGSTILLFAVVLCMAVIPASVSYQAPVHEDTVSEAVVGAVQDGTLYAVVGRGILLGDCSFKVLDEKDKEFLLNSLFIRNENKPNYKEEPKFFAALKSFFGLKDKEERSFSSIVKKIGKYCKEETAITLTEKWGLGYVKASGRLLFLLIEDEIQRHGYDRFPLKTIRANGPVSFANLICS